ncbi:hypothetical protein [Tritonibacter horizontis]|uniref:Sulfotransferase family protein n=1 Tax=Tritonibacter horizontis TaxID=1768241 RepID=A0A132C198_9RHOB|nr:hypothetical protein [Tritonibacter horizontis]KUP94378.1 hypothetical protein TRIHO_06970 [Tritonibacter horizontis]
MTSVAMLPSEADAPHHAETVAQTDAAGPDAGAQWRDLGLIPARVLRLVGMRRSGNHAICNWLQRNAPQGRALFLNNCRPGANPLRSHNGIEVSGQPQGSSDLQAAARLAGDGALVLVSYEDTLHGRYNAARPMSPPHGDAAFDCDLLIYRSFWNWSASLLKKLQANPDYRSGDRMAVAARALATYGDLLAEVQAAAETGRVAICYDRWCRDELYRARLLADLGLPMTDNALGPVQAYGGGSSFQKDADRAEDLASQDRWRQMLGDSEYQALLRLAALDPVLRARIGAQFPEDAARLARIAALPGFDAEDLT